MENALKKKLTRIKMQVKTMTNTDLLLVKKLKPIGTNALRHFIETLFLLKYLILEFIDRKEFSVSKNFKVIKIVSKIRN